MMVKQASFVCILFVLQLLSASSAEDQPAVQTKGGIVRGLLIPVADGYVSAFLGIPYAEPPVGDLRFKQPVPRKAWPGVWEATGFSQACYQPLDTTFPGFEGAEMWNPNTGLSEDCLYINVWAPHPRPSHAVVMVWIYGGGYTMGCSSLPLYDGRYLSHTEGVVVVSMNYRLGPLGFLALPGSSDVLGNAGLFDQRLALQWVSDNIEAFGGDPQSVTLFGESAGAALVGFHLMSPGSHSLFARAILQSGIVNAPWAAISLHEAWNRSLTLADLVGCPSGASTDVEACLRAVSPHVLVNRQHEAIKVHPLVGTTFAPTVDGSFLTELPGVWIETGKFKSADLLLGMTKDEGTYFLVYGAPGFGINHESLITREDFLKGVSRAVPGLSEISQEAVVFHYTDWADEFNGKKNRDALGAILGDYYFTCPILDFARKFSSFDNSAFIYYLDHRSSRNPWPEWMGVMHGYENEFIFGLPLNQSLGYTKEDEVLSRKMMKHWANFAKTGNPSEQGSAWPRFSGQTQEYIVLDTEDLKVRRMLKATQCKLWDSFLSKLQVITGNLDKVELQWKTEVQRWLSYMLEWKNQFGSYIAQKQKCEVP